MDKMGPTLNGKTFGGYRLGEVLGSGSSSTVYTAEPSSGGDKVALRVFATDLSRDKNQTARLVADMQKACAVQHPNLVPVRDIGTADWKGKRYLYVAMDQLQGESLKSRLAQKPGQPLPLDSVLHIASEVGAALQAIHKSGASHRHVNTGSVFLGRASGEVSGETSGETSDAKSALEGVYLLELGSALLPSNETQPAGQGAAKSGKTNKVQEDIRGLAQLVEEALSVRADNAAANAQPILPLRFGNAKVPARIDAVLRSVLSDTLGAEKSPRFDSVAAFVAALLGTDEVLPTLGKWSPDGRAAARPRPSAGNGLIFAALFAVVLGAIVGYWYYAQDAAPAPQPSTDVAVTPPPAPPLPAPATSNTATPTPAFSPAPTNLSPQAVSTDGGTGTPKTPQPGKIPPLRNLESTPESSPTPTPASPAATAATPPSAVKPITTSQGQNPGVPSSGPGPAPGPVEPKEVK